MKTTSHHVARRATALTLALALVGVAGAVDAQAADPVPTSSEASAFFLRWFPPLAPVLLLKDERGRDYRTSGLRVESPQSVGELRAARHGGRLVGSLGNYRCWTWTPPRPR